MILSNSNNTISSSDVDVLYKTGGDNSSTDQSKIIRQTSDNISTSYSLASKSSSSSLLSSLPHLRQIENTAKIQQLATNTTLHQPIQSIAQINNINSSSSFSSSHNMVLSHSSQHDLQHHHISPLLQSDHYHHQASPVLVTSDTAFPRSSLIMYTYPSNSPPATPQSHYHPMTAHRSEIDGIIADTLKDEHCTMNDGINSSGSVLVTNISNYNGNHSTHNSDDGHNSRSPNIITTSANLSHHDGYESPGAQSFTNLTIPSMSDSAQQTILNRESVYSVTAPNNLTTVAPSGLIHSMQAYDTVLHPPTPGR